MRLYLSSFRLGDHAARLPELVGSGRRAAVVANALDGVAPRVRASAVRQECEALGALGFDAAEVDLRSRAAADALGATDLVWARGGNVFVLRRALADSGCDDVLADLIRGGAVAYGGYSAAVCVLGTDLDGLQRVDDPAAVADPIMTGLGLLDRPVVPHVDSPGHPEGAACDDATAALTRAGRAHWALRDGDVLLVDGTDPVLLPRRDPPSPTPWS